MLAAQPGSYAMGLMLDQPMKNNGWPNSTGWTFWLRPQLCCLMSTSFTLACGETDKVPLNDLSMASPYNEQRLTELNGLAVFHQDGLDHAALVGFDLVEQLHRLDDA